MRKPLVWSYGVTTIASRVDTLLPRTLSSLRAAGFDRPRIFADGVSDGAALARASGLEVTCRSLDPDPVRQAAMHVRGTLGAAGNWIAAMHELYQRRPSADRFALFQDDFLASRNLRQYLERTPYPEKGYLNLYLFPVNEEVRPAGHVGFYEASILSNGSDPLRRQSGKGALALVFDRDAVVTLLSGGHLVGRATDNHRGFRNVDGGIVETMNKAGWREFVHWPSLVQHAGDETSIMGGRPHPKAISFMGEEFDCLSLLERDAVARA